MIRHWWSGKKNREPRTAEETSGTESATTPGAATATKPGRGRGEASAMATWQATPTTSGRNAAAVPTKAYRLLEQPEKTRDAAPATATAAAAGRGREEAPAAATSKETSTTPVRDAANVSTSASRPQERREQKRQREQPIDLTTEESDADSQDPAALPTSVDVGYWTSETSIHESLRSLVAANVDRYASGHRYVAKRRRRNDYEFTQEEDRLLVELAMKTQRERLTTRFWKSQLNRFPNIRDPRLLRDRMASLMTSKWELHLWSLMFPYHLYEATTSFTMSENSARYKKDLIAFLTNKMNLIPRCCRQNRDIDQLLRDVENQLRLASLSKE